MPKKSLSEFFSSRRKSEVKCHYRDSTSILVQLGTQTQRYANFSVSIERHFENYLCGQREICQFIGEGQEVLLMVFYMCCG